MIWGTDPNSENKLSRMNGRCYEPVVVHVIDHSVSSAAKYLNVLIALALFIAYLFDLVSFRFSSTG